MGLLGREENKLCQLRKVTEKNGGGRNGDSRHKKVSPLYLVGGGHARSISPNTSYKRTRQCLRLHSVCERVREKAKVFLSKNGRAYMN